MNSVNVTRASNCEDFVVFCHQEGSQVFVFDRWTSLGDMQAVIDREIKKQREEQEKRYASLGLLKQGHAGQLNPTQAGNAADYTPPPIVTAARDPNDEIPF